MKIARLFLTLIVLGCHFAATAKPSAKIAPAGNGCNGLLGAKYFLREFELEMPDWKNNLSLIKADLEAQAWSSVRTFFSKDWDTQVYYTATGAPTPELEIPLVDKDCKAVVLFIHGSGTVKSSGANFLANMSALSNAGYCAISFDLPFHASGSLRDAYMRHPHFYAYLKRIVEDIRTFNKPVFLSGHSFGPDVIFEFISLYPFAVAGAHAISPACIDSVSCNWYERFTTKMKFGGSVMENTLGGQFAGSISGQHGWNKGKYPDPTMVNPALRLRIQSGDREEYFPAPIGGPSRTPVGPNTYSPRNTLQRIFKNAAIVIEKGVGHYIFDFRDESGMLAVMRELFITLGEDPKGLKQRVDEMIKETGRVREARGAAVKLAHMSQFDLIFRSWFLTKYSERLASDILKQADERRAQAVILEWLDVKQARYREIMQEVYATENTDPEWYGQNKDRIEAAKKKNAVDMGLLAQYYKLRNRGATITIN